MNLQVETQFEYASGFRIDSGFTAKGGEVTSLVGPSGSGKSTLLALIAGLLKPIGGQISIGERVLFSKVKGVDEVPWNRNVGLLFQRDTLFPHLSIRKNLLFGSKEAATLSQWQFESIVEAFAIGDLLNRKPSQLSGGQRDRVALGRTLLSQPHALLLDEPLGSVEKSLRNSIFDFVKNGIVQSAIPLLLVSHDESLLARAAGQMLQLRDGTLANRGNSGVVNFSG